MHGGLKALRVRWNLAVYSQRPASKKRNMRICEINRVHSRCMCA